jgi:UDP-N-acetylmuramyl pentapeptide synthase
MKSIKIDESYLSRFRSYKEVVTALEEEFDNLPAGSAIMLERPKNIRYVSIFSDTLAYVCGRTMAAGEGTYTLKATQPELEERIAQLLGHQITGSPESGYRFKRAA